ncbi:MAG: hypothetical protein PHS57_06455 [Alphaproteobacteria bacterium]|nr:hypothetical protein [Alphaproteobacteria bacterium]
MNTEEKERANEDMKVLASFFTALLHYDVKVLSPLWENLQPYEPPQDIRNIIKGTEVCAIIKGISDCWEECFQIQDDAVARMLEIRENLLSGIKVQSGTCYEQEARDIKFAARADCIKVMDEQLALIKGVLPLDQTARFLDVQSVYLGGDKFRARKLLEGIGVPNVLELFDAAGAFPEKKAENSKEATSIGPRKTPSEPVRPDIGTEPRQESDRKDPAP